MPCRQQGCVKLYYNSYEKIEKEIQVFLQKILRRYCISARAHFIRFYLNFYDSKPGTSLGRSHELGARENLCAELQQKPTVEVEHS